MLHLLANVMALYSQFIESIMSNLIIKDIGNNGIMVSPSH
jgi:hypothetical protein